MCHGAGNDALLLLKPKLSSPNRQLLMMRVLLLVLLVSTSTSLLSAIGNFATSADGLLAWPTPLRASRCCWLTHTPNPRASREGAGASKRDLFRAS